jgi:GTPase involved in cell partitioning and DNA repair
VLLHLVDIAPPDPDADPVKDARAIAAELKKFSPELATRERWLVLNKIDLLPPADAEKRCKEIVRRLRWKGPVFRISGATRTGTKELCQAMMLALAETRGRAGGRATNSPARNEKAGTRPAFSRSGGRLLRGQRLHLRFSSRL